jgi:hypothetical protein
MSRRPCYQWLIGTLVPFMAACTSFHQVPANASVSRPELDVRFASPTRLVGRSHTGAEVVRRHVLRVIGRPLEVRRDSLVLEVKWSQGVGAFTRKIEYPPFVAVVPLSDPKVTVGERRFSRGRTAAAVLGPPVTLIVLFFIVCSAGECFGN